MDYQDKLVSKDPAVIKTLLDDIIERGEDFTKGDLFNFLFYKSKREIIDAVRGYAEVQSLIHIVPLSPKLTIPEIIGRLKQVLNFELSAMKPLIMESFANSIRQNPTKHELLYEQLMENSKSETNPYVRKKLVEMIEFIKYPDKVKNPFASLSL